MTITTAVQLFQVNAYDLECSARGVDVGKFAPVLVAKRQAWPSRPRLIHVARGSHDDAESAIRAAHSRGIEWVAHFG
jgi:hypothetical protein